MAATKTKLPLSVNHSFNPPSDFLSIECVDSQNFVGFGDGTPCILGIDEAGRGPVLGPMVYGCAIVKSTDIDELKAIGVDDSKALTDVNRRAVFARMQQRSDPDDNFLSYSLRIVHPRTISVQMKRRVRQSLNEISHHCAIELIRSALQNGICIKEVYVDLVGNKEEVYQEFLKSHFPSIQIIVSKKADSIFPIVGAASIVAKVTRDTKLAEWIFEEEGFEVPEEGIGSGYPSDPLTKKFIAKQLDPVFGYPSLVRFSWKTVDVVLDRKAIKCQWNFSADSLDSCKQKTLAELWAKDPASPKKKKFRRSAFFADRGLSNLEELS